MTARTNQIQKLAIAILWLFSAATFAQITVDTSLSTQELVQDILINGTCAETSNFISSTGTDFGFESGIAFFDASGTDFPFASGVVLTSGDANGVPGPNTSTESTGGWQGDTDLEDFTNINPGNSFDASSIQFDFVPLTEQLSFDFIMASEEYNQNFECQFTDAFAFILTDQTTGTSVNLAVIPGTNTPIEVTNIRPEVAGNCAAINEEFFGQYNFAPFNDENMAAINMNGQTVELTAISDVIIGNPYTIKLVVADDTDNLFNMSVFIEQSSFNIGSTDLGANLLVLSGNAPCDGDTVTLDATDPEATSYAWFLDGVVIPGETGPTLDVAVPGTYSVDVTLADLPDCVVQDEIVVQFITNDTVNLGEDITSCEGDTVTIDSGLAINNATFVWLQDGIEIAGETANTLDVTESGTYTIQATFNGSCTFPDEIDVTFNTTPTLDLGEDVNSCLNGPVSLDGTPDNVDPSLVTYQWFLDGAPIAGATSATFDATFPGVYALEATLNDCTGSDDVTINLANPDGSSCITNDLCMDAVTIACGDVVTGNTDGATSDDAPPGTCGTTPGAPGVWYTFTGTGNLIELAMCNSNYDTKLQVFEGPCDALVCVDGNDDSCGLQSEVDFLSEVGVEYYFYVFGFGTSTGDYELSINCVCDLTVDVGEDEILCPDSEPLVIEAVISGETVSNPVYDWNTGETTSSITVTGPGTFTVTVTTDGDCLATDEIIVTAPGPDDPACTVPDGDGCVAVDAGPDATVSCDEPCVDLTATFLGLDSATVLPFTETTSYIVDLVDCPLPPIDSGTPTNLTTDDVWSDVFNLPFTFTYFGVDYTSLTIGANGQISFNTTLANNANGWSFEPDELLPFNDEAAEPGAAEFPFNTIYGAFHDINPGTNSDADAINFLVSGTAPFRTFVLNFNAVPQFSCSDLLTSQQIILYETFNVIDVSIIDKPVCDTWNDGLAVIGLMGNNLTEFSVPPGRNTGAWEASNETWRFLPNGATSDPNVTFEWTDEDGNVISTDTTVNVCPIEETTYTFTVTILDDDGNVIGSESDTTTVFVDSLGDFEIDLGEDQFLCDQESFEIVNTLTGDDINNPTFLWSTGATTQNITVTETGTFTVEVTIDGCTLMESVFIQLGESPAFDLGPDLTTCLETQVILDATPSNVDPALVTYQWFQDGTEIVGETMATLEIIDFGTYQVLADNEGCTSSDSITISSENLTVSLPEGFQTCPDESQTLVASTDEAGVTFQWFLNGDPLVGETNPTLDISIVPEVLGEQIYEVQITRGVCTGAAQIPITLYDVGNCTISQGISPDGSPGLNDTLDLRFLADRSGIEILQIYNRLGRLVFEQESYTNEWRGQTDLSGELLPTGTYFYVIDFTSEDPEYGSQATGWIYLNRANEE